MHPPFPAGAVLLDTWSLPILCPWDTFHGRPLASVDCETRTGTSKWNKPRWRQAQMEGEQRQCEGWLSQNEHLPPLGHLGLEQAGTVKVSLASTPWGALPCLTRLQHSSQHCSCPLAPPNTDTSTRLQRGAWVFKHMLEVCVLLCHAWQGSEGAAVPGQAEPISQPTASSVPRAAWKAEHGASLATLPITTPGRCLQRQSSGNTEFIQLHGELWCPRHQTALKMSDALGSAGSSSHFQLPALAVEKRGENYVFLV